MSFTVSRAPRVGGMHAARIDLLLLCGPLHLTTAGNRFSLYSVGCMVRGVETLTYGTVLARFGHALRDPTRARLLLALRDDPGYPAELA